MAKIKTQCAFCHKEKMSTQNKSGRYFCDSACMANETRRIKIEEWLLTGNVKPRSEENSAIRNYIYIEQNDRCAICFHGRLHNGKHLTFVLDHIDGNSDSNFRENLRLICPNCDSQLDTYKSKNIGKGMRSKKRVEKLNEIRMQI